MYLWVLSYSDSYNVLIYTLQIYLCFLIVPTGSSIAQKATQIQPALNKQEGEQVSLDCLYETSMSFYQLYWYKQPPNGDMIFLIRQTSSSHHNESSGRYSIIFQKSAKSITLIISASQVLCSGGTRSHCLKLQHKLNKYGSSLSTAPLGEPS